MRMLKSKRKNLTNTGIYTASNFISSAIPFFLLPILTRLLTPSDYGQIAIFIALVSIFGAIVGVGLHGSIRVRFFKFNSIQFAGYIYNCFLVMLVALLISFVIIVLTGESIFGALDVDLKIIYLALFCAAFQYLVLVRLVMWQVKGFAISYGIFQVMLTLINVVVSLLLIVVFKFTYEGRVFGIVLSTLSMAIIGMVLTISNGEVLFNASKKHITTAINYGVPLIPHVLVGVLISMADRFILNRVGGAELLGVYFAAVQLSLPITVLVDAINKAFLPWSFEKIAKKENLAVVSYSYMIMAFIAIAALVYGAMLYFTYDLILGSEYRGAKNVTFIMIGAAVFNGCYLVVMKGIVYLEKTKVLSTATICLGSVYLIGAFYAAGNHGIIGLAGAYMLFQLIYFLSIWYLSNRMLPQPWFSYQDVIKHIAPPQVKRNAVD